MTERLLRDLGRVRVSHCGHQLSLAGADWPAASDGGAAIWRARVTGGHRPSVVVDGSRLADRFRRGADIGPTRMGGGQRPQPVIASCPPKRTLNGNAGWGRGHAPTITELPPRVPRQSVR